MIAGAHLGLLKTSLACVFPRVGEIPFDSERKLMTTVHAVPTEPVAGLEALSAHLAEERATRIVFTKGAPESLLPLAVSHWDGRQVLPLDEATREEVEARNRALAAGGMRVLAVGFRALVDDGAPDGAGSRAGPAAPRGSAAGWESDLVLAGLIGMIDPARPEAREAVLTAVGGRRPSGDDHRRPAADRRGHRSAGGYPR